MQTLLVPSQFGVPEHIPNIVLMCKSDLGRVKYIKIENITKIEMRMSKGL